MNPKVDTYLIEGCMRCSLGGTEQCKVNTWRKELIRLRSIVISCGLDEDYKWSQPCYTYKNKNILIVTAFKDYASVSFFKGSLLKDDKQLLVSPGVSSQAARQFRFTDLNQINDLEEDIRAYIFEAIEIEKAGLKVEFKKNPEPFPEELERKLAADPELKEAFNSLTTGRQRSYILFINAAKQTSTREARIDKYRSKILEGKGVNEY